MLYHPRDNYIIISQSIQSVNIKINLVWGLLTFRRRSTLLFVLMQSGLNSNVIASIAKQSRKLLSLNQKEMNATISFSPPLLPFSPLPSWEGPGADKGRFFVKHIYHTYQVASEEII